MGEAKRKAKQAAPPSESFSPRWAGAAITPMPQRPANAPPPVPMLHKELSWWAREGGAIVGVVIEDSVDRDFSWVVFERNVRNLYNAVDCRASLPTEDAARVELHAAMGEPQRKTLDDLLPPGAGVSHAQFVEAMEEVTGVVFARCPECGAPTVPGREGLLCDGCYRRVG